MSSEFRYLDVMTVRPSIATGSASTGRASAHQSLLVEPILLPEDLSHLNLDRQPDVSESDACFFYPSGQKNVNMQHVIHKVTQEKLSEYSLKQDRKSATKQQKKKTKALPPSSSLAAAGAGAINSKAMGTGSIESAPRKKQQLYYGRKPDVRTANLLNTLRFNEAKIVGIISTTT